VLALLPRFAEAGHETLADSVGLVATFMALWLAAWALSKSDWRLATGAGLFSGLGYLARPEVIVVPVVVALAWVLDLWRPLGRCRPARLLALSLMLALPALTAGGYAAIKGEISEKLSIRRWVGLGPANSVRRTVPQQVPSGLNDPRWDFSPKEESDHVAIRGAGQAFKTILNRWWEATAWFVAVMAVWGCARRKPIRTMLANDASPHPRRPEGLLLGMFALVYTVALVRHSASLGYVSWRHVMPLVVASIPWSAGGIYICCRRLSERLQVSVRAARFARIAAMAFAVVLSVSTQLNPHHLHHLSRWGHWAAGRWLLAHATPGEEVLDTRGWARFVSSLPGYDYWHVRQALTDSHLSYILVGLDELKASSARAATLRALLAYAGTPIEEFAASPSDPTPAVRIYRFRRPSSWEGFGR
jgi:hypothetical protein